MIATTIPIAQTHWKPFFQASPLIGYVLAYFVLGETLSARQMLGGALAAGLPIVAVPLFADQPLNAAVTVKSAISSNAPTTARSRPCDRAAE